MSKNKKQKKPPCVTPTPSVPRTDCASAPKRLTTVEAGLYGLAAVLTGWLLASGYSPREALAIVSALLLVVVVAVRVDMPTIRRVAARLLGPA